jgi:hypothetical protein
MAEYSRRHQLAHPRNAKSQCILCEEIDVCDVEGRRTARDHHQVFCPQVFCPGCLKGDMVGVRSGVDYC